MKRVCSILLALFVLLSLTGCRDSSERRAIRRQMDLFSGAAQPELPKTLALDNGVTLDEQVVYDANGVEIRVWGIYEDRSYYYVVTSLRNDSGRDLKWGTTGDGSVNGQSVYPYLNGDRTVYKQGMEVTEVCFYKSSLPLVKVPGPISFTLYVESEKDGREAKVPVSLNTSAGDGEAITPLSDTPFWSENGLELTLLAMQETSTGWNVHIAADNHSARSIFIEDNLVALSVNGTLIPHQIMLLYGFVSSGEQEVLTLSLDWYLLEAAGLRRGTAIQSVDIRVNIRRFDIGSEAQDTALHIDIPSVTGAVTEPAQPTEPVSEQGQTSEAVTEPGQTPEPVTEPTQTPEALVGPAEDL